MTLFVIFGCWQSGINELDLELVVILLRKSMSILLLLGLAVCNYWMPPGVNSSFAD